MSEILHGYPARYYNFDFNDGKNNLSIMDRCYVKYRYLFNFYVLDNANKCARLANYIF